MKNNWRTKKIGEICDILDSKRKPVTQKDRQAGPYPYYGATGVLDYVNEYIFDEDLVLVGEDGADWGAGAKTAYKVSGKYWINNHAHVIRPDRSILLDSWLVFYLNFSDLSNYITGATVKKLNQAKLKNIEIPVPPLETQKKIVTKIEELMDKINQAKQIRTQAQQNASYLLPVALHQIFGIQAEKESWKERDLGELFDITSSKRVFKHEWKNSGVPFYRAREIVNLSKGESFKTPIFISEHLYKKYKNKYGAPKAGDILVTGVGTLGVSYVVDENDKFYFKDGNIIWFKKKEDVSSVYVNYFFKSPNLKERIESNSAGATVKTFTIQTAKKTKIPLPPTQEQKEIVKYLDSLSEKTRYIQDLQSQTATELNDLERSILHKAFKGELI